MRIRPFATPGRFWRGNLHAHSSLSDGALNPVDVVEAYKRAGYDFLQVSDHFLGRFDWPIADTRKLRCNTFTTLIGAEIHAMATSAGEALVTRAMVWTGEHSTRTSFFVTSTS